MANSKHTSITSQSYEMIYLSFIFLALIIFFLPQSIIGLNIFDEGFIVSGAMLVNDGKLPYKDFLSMYGPGQYYLTAAIYRLFGEELIYVRVLHIIILVSLGLAIFLLSRRISRSFSTSLLSLAAYAAIVIYAQPNVGYPAITATLFLLLSVFSLIKWSESMDRRELAMASLMVGVAGLFRWDFGVFGLLALLITAILYQLVEGKNSNQSVKLFHCIIFSLMPAVLIIAVVYIPLIFIYSNPVQWYKEVPLFSLTEFAKWRGIDYVRPQFWSFLTKSTPTNFIVLILNLAYLAVPVLLALAALAMAMFHVTKRSANPDEKTWFVLDIFFALLCLFLLNQMRVRPGFPQGFPAIVASIPIAALVIKFTGSLIAVEKYVKNIFITFGLLAVCSVVTIRYEKWLSFAKEDTMVVRESRYAGIYLESKNKNYIDLVRYIRNHTKPDEAIFSGVVDHSRLFVNDTLIYFLTARPPADRFLELEPGISNSSYGQEVIVNALQKKNVKLIVLLDMLSGESNQTSKSNGIHMLNNYIFQNYHLDKTFGKYRVYLKNGEN